MADGCSHLSLGLLEVSSCERGGFPFHCRCMHAQYEGLLHGQRHNANDCPLLLHAHPGGVNAVYLECSVLQKCAVRISSTFKDFIHISSTFPTLKTDVIDYTYIAEFTIRGWIVFFKQEAFNIQ
ncbi:hypothetical protein ATANTOWER_020040 [Ataeniobius toweri]|uniref:Uncharacterized protein n=1 Tax=Ataeniobius toweri TaxID=208326 RepID=A0ABU7BSA3_9TELE|nr:hypothetical protein [Ataeniobius toweri]